MTHMRYSPEDKEYVQTVAAGTDSKHLGKLVQMLEADAPYSEIFRYGAQFLPRLRDPVTGKVDLDRLEGYTPEVDSYFDTVAEIPSLPERLSDLAWELGLYADGETVQVDSYYYSLDCDREIENALNEVSSESKPT
jgi:hypothetical protein